MKLLCCRFNEYMSFLCDSYEPNKLVSSCHHFQVKRPIKHLISQKLKRIHVYFKATQRRRFYIQSLHPWYHHTPKTPYKCYPSTLMPEIRNLFIYSSHIPCFMSAETPCLINHLRVLCAEAHLQDFPFLPRAEFRIVRRR